MLRNWIIKNNLDKIKGTPLNDAIQTIKNEYKKDRKVKEIDEFEEYAIKALVERYQKKLKKHSVAQLKTELEPPELDKLRKVFVRTKNQGVSRNLKIKSSGNRRNRRRNKTRRKNIEICFLAHMVVAQ